MKKLLTYTLAVVVGLGAGFLLFRQPPIVLVCPATAELPQIYYVPPSGADV